MVKEAGTKPSPRKKKCKKAKWLSEDALQRAEERSEVKGKVEKRKIQPTECRVLEKSKEK